jgi:hypothetical protein
VEVAAAIPTTRQPFGIFAVVVTGGVGTLDSQVAILSDERVRSAGAPTSITMHRYHNERLSVYHCLLMRTASCEGHAGGKDIPLRGVRSASNGD